MLNERPVTLAQRNIANAAILKRSPAVVKGPSPERLALMATALAPKMTHRNELKMAADKGSS